MPLEYDQQQNQAWNCNGVNCLIKRRSFDIPSKVAIAQTSPQNQTTPVNLTKSTSLVIPVDLNHLRDEVRSHHPLLAAIADQIQTMDVRDTLMYTKGVDVVAEMLDLHARQLLDLPLEEHVEPMNQTNIR
jgi:hypothetical protein